MLTVTVGIDPASPFASEMVTSVSNAVWVWNDLTPTTGNLVSGAANNVPVGYYDFESAVLHEMGHSLGLSHPNLGGAVTGSDTNFTATTDGADDTYNMDAGVDGIIGSADDVRGDDVNLNWFQKSNNNPFSIAGTVDSTTYSVDVSDLPGGDLFSTNPDRTVANDLFFLADTEASLQQGQPSDEAQRTLGHDDVAGILYAASGVDEIAGTADDYTLFLDFQGLTASADMMIAFDNAEASFAVSKNSGSFLWDGAAWSHIALINQGIFFNDGYDWFFNDVPVPEPATMGLLAMGGLAMIRRRRAHAA